MQKSLHYLIKPTQYWREQYSQKIVNFLNNLKESKGVLLQLSLFSNWWFAIRTLNKTL